ncbi:GL26976 [Drosophila persimilis]|uniref:GL26976 n=1 Tax=Drosophila persimilis TaxID=7234 RepID=B4H7I9_DROPE|nr:GL26976 [Drosophila persimilis]
MTLRLTLLLAGWWLLVACTAARPQDLGTGMALAMGQVKQLMETGGGARQQQSVEVLGQRVDGAMNLGFGEAMNLPLSG